MFNILNRSLKCRTSLSWVDRLLLLSPGITLMNTVATFAVFGYGMHLHHAISAPTSDHSVSANSPVYLPGLESNILHKPFPPTAASHPTVQLPKTDFYRLVTLSVLEAPTSMGRLDVIQSVFNRLNAPSVGAGQFGSSITEIVFEEKQYEPYFHFQASDIVDEASAIEVLRSRGYSKSDALFALNEVIANLQHPKLMADARKHVGGRTQFKGVSQYPSRWPNEDPLRETGENFFHIDPKSQTYEQLSQLMLQGPLVVQMLD